MAPSVRPARNLPVLARSTAKLATLGRPHEALVRTAAKLPDGFFDHEDVPSASMGHTTAATAVTVTRGVAHTLPAVIPSAVGYFVFGANLVEQVQFVIGAGILTLVTGVAIFALLPFIALAAVGNTARKKILRALPRPTYSENDAIRSLARQLSGLRKPWSKAQNSWAQGDHRATATQLQNGMRQLLGKRQLALAEVWGDLAGTALLAGGFTVNAGAHFSGMAEAFEEAEAPKAAARSRLYAAYSTSRWDDVETDELQRQRAIVIADGITSSDLRTYWNEVLPLLGYSDIAQSPMQALVSNLPALPQPADSAE